MVSLQRLAGCQLSLVGGEPPGDLAGGVEHLVGPQVDIGANSVARFAAGAGDQTEVLRARGPETGQGVVQLVARHLGPEHEEPDEGGGSERTEERLDCGYREGRRREVAAQKVDQAAVAADALRLIQLGHLRVRSASTRVMSTRVMSCLLYTSDAA